MDLFEPSLTQKFPLSSPLSGKMRQRFPLHLFSTKYLESSCPSKQKSLKTLLSRAWISLLQTPLCPLTPTSLFHSFFPPSFGVNFSSWGGESREWRKQRSKISLALSSFFVPWVHLLGRFCPWKYVHKLLILNRLFFDSTSTLLPEVNCCCMLAALMPKVHKVP